MQSINGMSVKTKKKILGSLSPNAFSEIQIFSMGIFRKAERLVKKIDFFYSTEMLRYDEDEDYKTFTGGLISLGIITAIIIGFAGMILSTLDQTSISTSIQVIKNQVPPNSTLQISPESPFRFGAQVLGLNLSDTKRYLDVTFEARFLSNGQIVDKVNLPLETCTKQYFSAYPQVVKNFDKLGAGGWLCPSFNTTMNLYGKYSSDQYSQYIILVGACHNQTDPSKPCASPSEIDQFFIDNQDYLYFSIYFINPQINSDKKDYKKYYLDDMNYFIFGRSLGSESFIYFTDYTINTDDSIWPFSHILEDKGCIVEDVAINHPFQANIDGVFGGFILAKSPNSIIYTREVQKISAVFSFIGGMIGAISAVLFIIKIYTNVAFEFSISSELFKDERKVSQNQREGENSANQKPVTEHISINFFTFIKYNCYRFMKMIGKPCDWPVMRYAEKCKEQISKQLDVKILLKRIIFLEHCLTYLMEDFHLSALQMKKPFSPQSIKLIREKCENVQDQDCRSSSCSESASQSTCKQFNMKEQIETPSNCVSFNSPAPIVKSRFGRPSNQVANELIIADIENSRSSNRVTKMDAQRTDNILCVFQKKIARNSRRSSHLQDLHKSAMEGNVLSAKIWNQLDDRTKRSAEEAQQTEKERFQ